MIRFAVSSLIMCMGLQYGAGIPMPDETSYAPCREAGSGLRLYMEPAAFWDAHDTCQRKGGVLASPTTDALLQAMRTAMTNNGLESSNVFVGIASQAKGDRSLSTFSHASLQWAADEPSNAADEQCLALTGAGALADVSCDRAHPYFCREELAHKSHICERALSNGYEYEPRTGSCYKFHRIALAFRPAQAACHAEGGTLAVINSVTESDVLEEIFDKNPPETINGTVDTSHAVVGFRKYEDDVWATIDGDTLAEAGFSNWDQGEPNNATDDDELCGSITKEGLLNDISCKRLMAFICEINLKD